MVEKTLYLIKWHALNEDNVPIGFAHLSLVAANSIQDAITILETKQAHFRIKEIVNNGPVLVREIEIQGKI